MTYESIWFVVSNLICALFVIFNGYVATTHMHGVLLSVRHALCIQVLNSNKMCVARARLHNSWISKKLKHTICFTLQVKPLNCQMHMLKFGRFTTKIKTTNIVPVILPMNTMYYSTHKIIGIYLVYKTETSRQRKMY